MDKLPKTIAVIYLGRKGGGAVYAYEMTKGLIENGCKVHLFISKYVENIDSWLSLNTVNTELIKTYQNKMSFIFNTILLRLFSSKKLKKKYKDITVDACYLPMADEHIMDCYIVNILGNPYKISTIHDPIAHSSNNSDVKNRKRVSSILNYGIYDKKPDEIVILSKFFVDTIANEYDIGIEHIHVIPHCSFGYYKEKFNKEEFQYDGTKTNFLFFGRIDKYKGLDILSAAYEQYRKWNTNSSLTVVGSGDFSYYEKNFKDIENVTIINRWIPDEEICSYFVENKNVILVLPYKDATQSGVIPIAMMAGIPVIASNSGGLTEQIEDGKTGYLFEANEVGSLVQTMVYVSTHSNDEVIQNAKIYNESLSSTKLSRLIIEMVKKHEEI